MHQSHRSLRDGSAYRGVPGISCQATITPSLRDNLRYSFRDNSLISFYKIDAAPPVRSRTRTRMTRAINWQPSSAPDSSIRVKSDPFRLAALNLGFTLSAPWMGFCRLDASSMERETGVQPVLAASGTPPTPRTIVSPVPCSLGSALLVSDVCGLCVFVVKFCPQLCS
jgi:hypothetical protein